MRKRKRKWGHTAVKILLTDKVSPVLYVTVGGTIGQMSKKEHKQENLVELFNMYHRIQREIYPMPSVGQGSIMREELEEYSHTKRRADSDYWKDA